MYSKKLAKLTSSVNVGYHGLASWKLVAMSGQHKHSCLYKQLTGNTASSDSYSTQAIQDVCRQNARTAF